MLSTQPADLSQRVPTLAGSPDTRRRGRPGSGLLFALLALGLATSGVPSPLYDAYQREWGFSSLTLTLIFAVYAVAALAALLVVGKLSDSIGRKPVLLTTQVMLLAGLALFVAARSPAALMAARGLHGAAIGSIAATAGAGLLDLRPAHGAFIGRVTGLILTFGMTAGVLGSAMIGEWVPHPLVVPYLVVGAATVLTLAGTIAMPEPLRTRAPLDLRISLGVPARIKGTFWFAAVSTMATWALLGLYLSLAPGLADQATGSDSLLVGGTITAALIGSGAVAQLFAGHLEPLRMAIGGDLILGATMLLSVAAAAAHSAGAMYVTAVAMGVGLGLSFNGSLRALAAVIPAAERGHVMSTYYLVGYLSLAVPAVLAGLSASHFGLTSTYVAFGIAVAVVCGTAAWLGRKIAASQLSR